MNTFVAVPREAVCLKCRRPANRPLSWLDKALSLIFFPYGLIKSALLRASAPYAASQALWLAILSMIAWVAFYFLVIQHRI